MRSFYFVHLLLQLIIKDYIRTFLDIVVEILPFWNDYQTLNFCWKINLKLFVYSCKTCTLSSWILFQKIWEFLQIKNCKIGIKLLNFNSCVCAMHFTKMKDIGKKLKKNQHISEYFVRTAFGLLFKF